MPRLLGTKEYGGVALVLLAASVPRSALDSPGPLACAIDIAGIVSPFLGRPPTKSRKIHLNPMPLVKHWFTMADCMDKVLDGFGTSRKPDDRVACVVVCL